MDNQYLRENYIVISVKVFLGLCILGYMSALMGTSEEKHLTSAKEDDKEENLSTLMISEEISVTPKIEKIIILQPHCKPVNMEINLQLIVMETSRCKPGDMEKEKRKQLSSIKKKKLQQRKAKSETTESMVVYIAVALLLVSLGAALLEVFKFSNQPNVKAKPALNRSYSLADLTVMRHTRKELMRRDSIMEGVETARNPSKQLEQESSPLYRRCSFPVGPGDSRIRKGKSDNDFQGSSGSIAGGYVPRSLPRKASLDVEGVYFPSQHRHTHIRLLHRH